MKIEIGQVAKLVSHSNRCKRTNERTKAAHATQKDEDENVRLGRKEEERKKKTLKKRRTRKKEREKGSELIRRRVKEMQNLNEDGPEVAEAEFCRKVGSREKEEKEEVDGVGDEDSVSDQPESLVGCLAGRWGPVGWLDS